MGYRVTLPDQSTNIEDLSEMVLKGVQKAVELEYECGRFGNLTT